MAEHLTQAEMVERLRQQRIDRINNNDTPPPADDPEANFIRHKKWMNFLRAVIMRRARINRGE